MHYLKFKIHNIHISIVCLHSYSLDLPVLSSKIKAFTDQISKNTYSCIHYITGEQQHRFTIDCDTGTLHEKIGFKCTLRKLDHFLDFEAS